MSSDFSTAGACSGFLSVTCFSLRLVLALAPGFSASGVGCSTSVSNSGFASTDLSETFSAGVFSLDFSVSDFVAAWFCCVFFGKGPFFLVAVFVPASGFPIGAGLLAGLDSAFLTVSGLSCSGVDSAGFSSVFSAALGVSSFFDVDSTGLGFTVCLGLAPGLCLPAVLLSFFSVLEAGLLSDCFWSTTGSVLAGSVSVLTSVTFSGSTAGSSGLLSPTAGFFAPFLTGFVLPFFTGAAWLTSLFFSSSFFSGVSSCFCTGFVSAGCSAGGSGVMESEAKVCQHNTMRHYNTDNINYNTNSTLKAK